MRYKVFENDPFIILQEAFYILHPDKNFIAQIVPEIKDDNGVEVCGCTTIMQNGIPMIEISANLTIANAIEVFAHELAHVATPQDINHGCMWEAEFDSIFNEYNNLENKFMNNNISAKFDCVR